MTVKETFAEIKRKPDAKLAGSLCNYLRRNGANYNEIVAMAERHGISRDDWETLMQESDYEDSRS